MTKAQKVDELMRITGKGKLACDIALTLAHDSVENALVRMHVSYPRSMKVKQEDASK